MIVFIVRGIFLIGILLSGIAYYYDLANQSAVWAFLGFVASFLLSFVVPKKSGNTGHVVEQRGGMCSRNSQTVTFNEKSND